MATNPWPSETRLENRPMIQKAFDPERVDRYILDNPGATNVNPRRQGIFNDGKTRVVLAKDFDALLALYKDLKAQQAFHGF